MNKKTLLFLLSLLFFMVPDAHAQEWPDEEECCFDDETNFYVKAFGGVNFLQDTTADGNKATYQAGYIVGGSLGFCWCYGLQVEAEYAFRSNDIRNIDFFVEGFSNNGYFQASSCMGNLLWNLPLTLWSCGFSCIEPFVGAGIGCDFQQTHSSNSRIIFDQSWSHFSWQLMAGVACPLFYDLVATFEYKYHQGGCQFYNNAFYIGLLYNFGYMR